MAIRTRTSAGIIAAITVAALPHASGAQNAAADPSGRPVAWGGDLFEYSPGGFTLTGRAEITQGDNRLRADSVTVVTTGGSDPTRIEASGDVYFVTPDQTMRGDRAVYTLASAEVVVTGDVILTQGLNVVTGGRLVYNVDTENARMEGAPTPGAGSRVQGVFYPEGSAN